MNDNNQDVRNNLTNSLTEFIAKHPEASAEDVSKLANTLARFEERLSHLDELNK